MDKLLECAKAFEKLLDVQYHMIIGRKGKTVELRISFAAVEFHHLIGLHKLHDLRLARGSREKIFTEILCGKIGLSNIENSRNYGKIKNRIEPLIEIESLFDKNSLIFRYNEKRQAFSVIEAEYLIAASFKSNDIYIFLDKRASSEEFYCRSFFPKENRDYTIGQAAYTLLFKEKISLGTGQKQTQYDRLTSRKNAGLNMEETEKHMNRKHNI